MRKIFSIVLIVFLIILLYITLTRGSESNKKIENKIDYATNNLNQTNSNDIVENNKDEKLTISDELVYLDFDKNNSVIFQNEHLKITVLEIVTQKDKISIKSEVENLASKSEISIDKVKTLTINDMSLNPKLKKEKNTSMKPGEKMEIIVSASSEINNTALNYDVMFNIRTISQSFEYAGKNTKMYEAVVQKSLSIDNNSYMAPKYNKFMTIYKDNNYEILCDLHKLALDYLPNIIFINNTNSNAELSIENLRLKDKTKPYNLYSEFSPEIVVSNTGGFYSLYSVLIDPDKDNELEFEFSVNSENNEYDVNAKTKTVQYTSNNQKIEVK